MISAHNGTTAVANVDDGVSTHGLIWYSDMVSGNLFRQVSADWNCNVFRLAMYSVDYCADSTHDESLRLLRKGIDAAVAADAYVIVDWHILTDGNPNQYIDRAKEFFDLNRLQEIDIMINVLFRFFFGRIVSCQNLLRQILCRNCSF